MITDSDTSTNETTATAKPSRARRPTPAMKPTPAPTSPAAPMSKSDMVIKLLTRAKGATPIELITATDWRPHSVRAFLSGLRKKGLTIVREARKNGDFVYRIVTGQPAPTSAADGATGPTGTETPSETVDAVSSSAAEA